MDSKMINTYWKRSKMNSNHSLKIENAMAQSCKGKDGKVEVQWNTECIWRLASKVHLFSL